MLLTDNHLTCFVGIDIHFTTLPPYNPFHPYIGIVIDPADYIPFIGTDVHVNGFKRGNSDTGGIIIPLVHIPLFTPPWLMTPIIGHESMNFFASEKTYSDGTRLSPKGYMLMTCNDIGIPLSLSIGKTKIGKKMLPFAPTLFAPTSFSLPIPTGKPVMVGGPYVPDWAGMATGLVMSIGFSTLLKHTRGLLNLNKKAAKLMSGADDVIPEQKILNPGDKYPDWKGPVDYSDIKNPKKAGPNKPFSKNQKDQIYDKNKKENGGYIVSDKDGTILEAPKKSEKGVTPSQYEGQIDHKTPKSKGGENTGENAQVLSRKQNRDKWDSD